MKSLPVLLLVLTPPALAQIVVQGDSPDGDPAWIEVTGADQALQIGAGSGGIGSAEAPVQDLVQVGPAPEGDQASAAAFTPDGARFLVAHRFSRNLIVYDAATQAFLAEVALSGSPNDVAVALGGTRAVTANFFEATASIVDLGTNAEIAVVPVGNQPGLVRVTPDGTTAVVANSLDQTLSVIDVATASEVHRIAGCGFQMTSSIAFEPGTITNRPSPFAVATDTLAIHPDVLNDEIDFFDLAAGTVSSIPALAPDPRGIAVTPNGQTAVIAHFGAAQLLSIVDVATQTVTKVIATGVDLREPVAIRADGSKAAVAIQNAVIVVDLVTNAISPQLATASVDGLIPTADGNYVLGVGYQGPLISWSTNSIVKALNNTVSTPVGAVSPTDPRAVLVANIFAEDMLVLNTNGAAGFIESSQPSGPAPEADATRKVAISADGTRAVATNVLSDTASVIDVATGAILAVVDVGDRPADVAITPDGSRAVVANLDSTFASVIDLGTFAVASVPISTRASQVEISPDGQFAYLSVVASGDGVWRVDLNTLTASGGKLPIGNMGSIFFMFQQSSGMTLSHDGATLVSCGTYDDTVTIVDTATWSVAATVPVGDFPGRAVFSDDDATIWVSCRDSDVVAEVTNAGGASALSRLIPVGDQPFEMAPTADGATLYVGNFGDDTLGVVDLAAGVQTQSVQLSDAPQGIHLTGDESAVWAATGFWSVSLGPGPKVQINASGALEVVDTTALAVTDQVPNAWPPAMLAVTPNDTVALAPSPFGDGLVRTILADPPLVYCTAKTSSAGCVAAIGSSDPAAQPVSGANDYSVTASALQGAKNGIFFFSLSGPLAAPFSGGTLCVQPPLGRTPIQFSFGSSATSCDGAFALVVNDGTSLHDPGPGSSVWMQTWYRDPNNGAGTLGTALSDGIRLDY